jgi:hypothetical protein
MNHGGREHDPVVHHRDPKWQGEHYGINDNSS